MICETLGYPGTEPGCLWVWSYPTNHTRKKHLSVSNCCCFKFLLEPLLLEAYSPFLSCWTPGCLKVVAWKLPFYLFSVWKLLLEGFCSTLTGACCFKSCLKLVVRKLAVWTLLVWNLLADDFAVYNLPFILLKLVFNSSFLTCFLQGEGVCLYSVCATARWEGDRFSYSVVVEHEKDTYEPHSVRIQVRYVEWCDGEISYKTPDRYR